MKVTVTESERKDKRLKATFTSSDGTERSTHFGYKGGSTYIDHGDEKKRAAYLARHRVNENWDDPKTAGALSRWLLWGDHKTLQANVRAFKRKFTST